MTKNALASRLPVLRIPVLRIIAALIGVGTLIWVGSAAANDEVFVVPRVPVSAQADSAIAAKQAAELKGRRQAMDLLLRRLTPQDDWGYLPRLARGEAAPLGDGAKGIENPYNDPYENGALPEGQLPAAQTLGRPRGKQAIALTNDQLRQFEQSFEVYDEKSSPTTYRAFITYRFKPNDIRDLLINSGLPYSEAQTRIALVLPVLETDRGLYLWEQNNPWLKAWQGRQLGYELTPMTAPLGDLEDAASLTARAALALDQEKLAGLAARYGVNQVIVAHARLSQKNGEDQVRVRLINGLRESGSLSANPDVYSANDALESLTDGAARRLENTNGARTPLPEPGPYGRDGIQSREPGDVLAETSLAEPTGNFPSLADRAIVASVSKYSSSWKAQTLIDHSISNVLRATAFFRSINEWRKIRAALVSTPLIGSVQIRNISREGAEMSIQAYGDPGKLVVAMESQGVSLWTYHQGPIEQSVWNIATPETAARIPASVQRAPEQQRRRFRSGTDGWGEDPLNGETLQPVNDTLLPLPEIGPIENAAPYNGPYNR